MLSTLSGWHLLIVAGALCAVAVGVLVIVILAIRSSRRRAELGDLAGSTADRLAELNEMRARGLVTEDEFTAKRQDILGNL
jgi:uncharacterized membrane protein